MTKQELNRLQQQARNLFFTDLVDKAALTKGWTVSGGINRGDIISQKGNVTELRFKDLYSSPAKDYPKGDK